MTVLHITRLPGGSRSNLGAPTMLWGDLRRRAALQQQRPHRTLRGASGAEIAAVKAIKGAIRGEEAEASGVADHDTRGSIRYFDDVSLGVLDLGRLGLGHACSIAE